MLKCKLVGSTNSPRKRECFKCKYLAGNVLLYTEGNVTSLRGDGQVFIIPVV